MQSILIKKTGKNKFDLFNSDNISIASIAYKDIFNLTYLGNALINIGNQNYQISHRLFWRVTYTNTIIKLIDSSTQKVLSIFEFQKTKSSPVMVKTFPGLVINDQKYTWTSNSLIPITNSINNWQNEKREIVVNYNKFSTLLYSEVKIETELTLSDPKNILLIIWGFYLLPKSRNPFFQLFLMIIISIFVLFTLLKTFIPIIFG